MNISSMISESASTPNHVSTHLYLQNVRVQICTLSKMIYTQVVKVMNLVHQQLIIQKHLISQKPHSMNRMTLRIHYQRISLNTPTEMMIKLSCSVRNKSDSKTIHLKCVISEFMTTSRMLRQPPPNSMIISSSPLSSSRSSQSLLPYHLLLSCLLLV